MGKSNELFASVRRCAEATFSRRPRRRQKRNDCTPKVPRQPERTSASTFHCLVFSCVLIAGFLFVSGSSHRDFHRYQYLSLRGLVKLRQVIGEISNRLRLFNRGEILQRNRPHKYNTRFVRFEFFSNFTGALLRRGRYSHVRFRVLRFTDTERPRRCARFPFHASARAKDVAVSHLRVSALRRIISNANGACKERIFAKRIIPRSIPLGGEHRQIIFSLPPLRSAQSPL